MSGVGLRSEILVLLAQLCADLVMYLARTVELL